MAPIRHCANCGTALVPFLDHGIERQRCPSCGKIAYENSKPAVGAIVLRGGLVLLARRGREPRKGMWDLPGGFLEAGEHPEVGVMRELAEEAGVAARVVRLLHVGMGEYAGDPTLNLVYLATVEGEPVAADDVAEFRWFPLDGLPDLAWRHEAEALTRIREELKGSNAESPP